VAAVPTSSPVVLELARGRVRVRITADPLRVVVERDGRPGAPLSITPWARDGTVHDRFVRVTEGVVAHERLEPEDELVGLGALPRAAGAAGGTLALRAASGRRGTLRVGLPADDVVVVELTVDGRDPEDPHGTTTPEDPPLRIGARWATASGTRLAGLGARHHPSVDHAGRRIQLGADRRYLGPGCSPAMAAAGGVPQGDYAPVPFLQSSDGWAAWLDTAGNGTRFDLDAGAASASVRSASGPLRLVLHVHPGPVQRLLAFQRATGRPALLPDWGYGFWKSRDVHEHQDQVEEDVRGCRWHDIPLDAVVLDSPWETQYNTWRPNPHQLPDFGGMLRRLREDGVRTVVWVTPWVNVDAVGGQTPPDPASIRLHARPAETYAEGARTGAYVRPPATEAADHLAAVRDALAGEEDALEDLPVAGAPYLAQWWMGRGSPIDFTGPGEAWWRTQAETTLALGVQGIKADDGEGYYLPETVRFADGTTGATRAWRWGDDYRRSMRRALERVHPGQGVLFGRSGWTGQQATGMLWAGDQASDFWSLRVLLAATISAAHSGISNWSHDVGGYLGDAGVARCSPELLVRWAQLGCFTPLMQAHARLEQEPWTYDHRTLDLFRGAALLHEMLVPYVLAAARSASRSGVPIVRPLAWLDPGDDRLWGVPDAFGYGPSLLVAPIVDEGSDGRTVPLPEGRWVETWSGREVVARRGDPPVPVAAPLERTPVWVRSGAIVVSHPLEHVARGLGDVPAAERPYVATLWGRPDRGRAVALLPDGAAVRWRDGRWEPPDGRDVTTAER
jgi:alpha-glucosidase (family GH31 glycosyl hydrolase)